MIAHQRTLFSRLRGMVGKIRSESELSAELQAHLDALTEENIRRGMPTEEARYAARRAFGGVEQTKELYSEQRSLPFLETLVQDTRYALRGLRKSPSFTLVTILTLAAGIGATSAVFSAIDRILFRSLPYPQEERLVSFGFVAPIERNEFMLGADYYEWRAQQTAFESMTTMIPGVSDCDVTEENPVRLSCAAVESTFLTTFGIHPTLGRNFTVEEDRPHAPNVALISNGLWRTRFSKDPGVVGKTLKLDGHPTTITGVLPVEFEMPTLLHTDVLVPQALDEAEQRHPKTGAVLRAFARLKPGVTAEQAALALRPMFENSLQFVPAQFSKEVHLVVRSLRDRQVHDARLASWILLDAVLAVLLLACTNVASLLLARTKSRQRELAVRTALGATRGRLIRQAFTESLLLGSLGGALGCWVAYVLLRVFLSIAPDGIPRLQQAGLDARVVLFTVTISLISGLTFGLAPALLRPTPEALTGKEARATSRGLVHQSLVVVQIALSLVLLSGAGLLLRSLRNLQNTPTGMTTEHVLAETVSLGDYHYPDAPQQEAFFDQLTSRLRALPGVTALAISDSLPPAGPMHATIYAGIEVVGHPHFAAGTGGMVAWRSVTPEYFSTLGIPVLRGRAFTKEDRLPSADSIILSEALARHLFAGGEDPLGKQMRFGQQGPWRTIVGIAANVKNNGLVEESDPEFYIPWKNDPAESLDTGYILLRTAMNPKAVSAWMLAETSATDPTLPVKIESLADRVGKLSARPRFNAMLLSLFAVIGLLLAAIGIYGVVGYLVAQRTQEFGIRLALGATPKDILRAVLTSVARWTLAGSVFGVLGAWLGTQFLQSLLFDVTPHDATLLGFALLVLLATVSFAAWIPARRVLRVDPMVALRYE
jgi:putative ABC transport system permease protein